MNGLLSLPSGPLEIVARTATVFLVVVIGLRLGGKREVGQLGVIDLVALLLLSNAVQNAMVGDDTTLVGGVLAAIVILVSARAFDLLVRRFPRLRRAVVGEPRVLISHGDVLRRALREEDVSMDELEEALREHGLEHMREAKLAILEVDGSISIIPEPEAADRYQAGEGADSKSRRAGRIPRHNSRQRGRTGAPSADSADPASKEVVS